MMGGERYELRTEAEMVGRVPIGDGDRRRIAGDIGAKRVELRPRLNELTEKLAVQLQTVLSTETIATTTGADADEVRRATQVTVLVERALGSSVSIREHLRKLDRLEAAIPSYAEL